MIVRRQSLSPRLSVEIEQDAAVTAELYPVLTLLSKTTSTLSRDALVVGQAIEKLHSAFRLLVTNPSLKNWYNTVSDCLGTDWVWDPSQPLPNKPSSN